MDLTVLGCATPLPKIGEPCSGYLLSGAGSTILIDCGSGVFPRLAATVDPGSLAGVWISHMHPDHCGDLVALANWALNTNNAPRIRVVGPAGWDKRLNAFLAENPSSNIVADVFQVDYIEDGTNLDFGDIKVVSHRVNHSIMTFGARATVGKGVFAYSGDTGECDALRTIADRADLFLCEAGSAEPAEYHLTASQARSIATESRVGELLLTHMPDEVRRSLLTLADAQRSIAVTGQTYTFAV